MTPNRFPTVNWVPRKIEVPIVLPAGSLVLDKFLGRGMQPDEHALPDSDEGQFPCHKCQFMKLIRDL